MLDESTRAVIKRLHEKEGKGIRELARDFSVSRNTIKRCLNGSYVKNRKKSPNQMFLQKHYEQIKQMYYDVNFPRFLLSVTNNRFSGQEM